MELGGLHWAARIGPVVQSRHFLPQRSLLVSKLRAKNMAAAPRRAG